MSLSKRLCELCVETVGVTGVSLGIVSDEYRSTVCATDEVSDGLEDLQLTMGEGPAVDAVRDGYPVLVPDLFAESVSRWPGYTEAALEAGVRAVFVFPVQVGAIRLGSLAMYRDHPGVLDVGQLDDAHRVAEAAAVLLSVGTGADTAEAFVWALNDRSRFHPQVHQAVGATMVELGVDARQAFARVRAHAFATGRPIAEVASDIVAKKLRLERD
jgi:hypothetical protein